MSELTEELKRASIAANIVSSEENGPGLLIVRSDDEEKNPFLSNQQMSTLLEYYFEETMRVLRRVVRYHAGAKFESSFEAFDKTREKTISEFTPILVSALCDSILVGLREHPTVFLSEVVPRLSIPKLPTFRKTSNELSLDYFGDADTMTFLNQYVFTSAMALAETTGFSANMFSAEKIWDFWFMALRSCVSAMLLVGVQVGTTRAQEAVQAEELRILEGIQQATESQEND